MSEAREQASMVEWINEKIHEYVGSSSSDSEAEAEGEGEKHSSHSLGKKRLFGRKEPLHKVLGGGRFADIVLWRNKQLSGSILAGVTFVWLLFECMGYHLLTFICHLLIFLLAACFLWSSATSFVNRFPPKFPDITLPEDMLIKMAHILSYEINEAFATFGYVASGKDQKNFLKVIAGLWIVSVIGSWFSLLTLFYIIFLMACTGPVLYEMYEEQVDTAGEKAIAEFNKHYAVLDAKVLQKIPLGPFADKKKP